MFDENFEVEDETMMDKIARKTIRSIPKPTSSFHYAMAMIFNLSIIFTAKPFFLIPRVFRYVFCFMSFIAAWRYLLNYKTYTIIEFESLCADLKKKTVL